MKITELPGVIWGGAAIGYQISENVTEDQAQAAWVDATIAYPTRPDLICALRERYERVVLYSCSRQRNKNNKEAKVLTVKKAKKIAGVRRNKVLAKHATKLRRAA